MSTTSFGSNVANCPPSTNYATSKDGDDIYRVVQSVAIPLVNNTNDSPRPTYDMMGSGGPMYYDQISEYLYGRLNTYDDTLSHHSSSLSSSKSSESSALNQNNPAGPLIVAPVVAKNKKQLSRGNGSYLSGSSGNNSCSINACYRDHHHHHQTKAYGSTHSSKSSSYKMAAASSSVRHDDPKDPKDSVGPRTGPQFKTTAVDQTKRCSPPTRIKCYETTPTLTNDTAPRDREYATAHRNGKVAAKRVIKADDDEFELNPEVQKRYSLIMKNRAAADDLEAGPITHKQPRCSTAYAKTAHLPSHDDNYYSKPRDSKLYEPHDGVSESDRRSKVLSLLSSSSTSGTSSMEEEYSGGGILPIHNNRRGSSQKAENDRVRSTLPYQQDPFASNGGVANILNINRYSSTSSTDRSKTDSLYSSGNEKSSSTSSANKGRHSIGSIISHTSCKKSASETSLDKDSAFSSDSTEKSPSQEESNSTIEGTCGRLGLDYDNANQSGVNSNNGNNAGGTKGKKVGPPPPPRVSSLKKLSNKGSNNHATMTPKPYQIYGNFDDVLLKCSAPDGHPHPPNTLFSDRRAPPCPRSLNYGSLPEDTARNFLEPSKRLADGNTRDSTSPYSDRLVSPPRQKSSRNELSWSRQVKSAAIPLTTTLRNLCLNSMSDDDNNDQSLSPTKIKPPKTSQNFEGRGVAVGDEDCHIFSSGEEEEFSLLGELKEMPLLNVDYFTANK